MADRTSQIEAPARRWVDPNHAEPIVSYAQNAEDVRLARLFHDLPTGAYVDVGAAHPTELSVTKMFSDRGWRGLNVEPGPHFDQLQAERPADVNIRCLVGTTEGRAVLYVPHPQTGWATMHRRALDDVDSVIESIEEVELPVRRLDGLIDEHLGDQIIHFLKVDVEGAEPEVIASIDLQTVRPICIVIEAVAISSRTPTHQAFEPAILESGYLPAGFDGLNRFYLRDDHEHLVDVLAYPVGPLDWFTTRVTAEAEAAADDLGRLRAEFGALRDDVHGLQRHLHQHDQKLDRLASEARTLAAQRDAERDRQQEALNRLVEAVQSFASQRIVERDRHEEAVDRLQQQLQDLQSAHEQLDAEHRAVLSSRTWRYGARAAHALRGTVGMARGRRPGGPEIVVSPAVWQDRRRAIAMAVHSRLTPGRITRLARAADRLGIGTAARTAYHRIAVAGGSVATVGSHAEDMPPGAARALRQLERPGSQ